MLHERTLSGLCTTAAAIALLAGSLACHADRAAGGENEIPAPPGESGVLGMLEGAVDELGNVTFSPVSASMGRARLGVSAEVYGTQNVNARLYTSPVTIDSTATTKTWQMPLGFRNLLSYPIGSNQGGATPSDTLGVYVALIGGPTVTATSGSCTAPCSVQLQKYDGTAAFTAPNQPYFYWHERLAAVQPAAAGDTVSGRRTFVFSGPRAVKNFRFVLIIGAAWPPPQEMFWSVFYNAATDSQPELRASPPWKKYAAVGTPSESWSASTGRLTLGTTTSYGDLYMYRADSLSAATPAYIEAQLKLNGNPNQTAPQAALGLGDGTDAVTVGVARNRIGFVYPGGFFGLTWQFIGGVSYAFPSGDARSLHTYRLRKFGADSATIEVNGMRVLGLAGSQFTATPFFIPTAATAFFGAGSYSNKASSDWAYVTYGIGQSQP